MRNMLVLLLCLIYVQNMGAQAAPIEKSLFLSPQEISMINHTEKSARPEPPPIRLHAIIYDSPQHWTVWLGKKKYTSSQRYDGTIIIHDINPHQVTILVKNEKQISQLITLGLGQSYPYRQSFYGYAPSK